MRADLAVRNLRVLARGVLRALEVGDDVPEAVPHLRELAAAAATIRGGLDDPARRDESRRRALRAGAIATRALDETSSMSVNVLVAQVRSMAVDLISGLGEEPSSAPFQRCARRPTSSRARSPRTPRPARRSCRS